MTESITLEVPAAEEWDSIHQMFNGALNFDPNPMGADAERDLFEAGRSMVARRGDEIVGTLGATTRRISVPGAVIPAAHGCRGGVSPMVRRQGVLTRMMRKHFEDARELGEAITLCWASEARIYHRFGYGMATRRVGLNINTREAGIPATEISGRLVPGTAAELRDSLVKVYDSVYADHPGWSERSDKHWDYQLADLPWQSQGASSLRVLLHEGDQGVDGYALWRVTGEWTESGPVGQVRVQELVTTTAEAYTALWKFLLTVDLTRSVQVWSVGVDEPLFYWLGEPRQMGVWMNDGLFIRVVDVPAALSARRYAAPVDVVIEVVDEFMPVNSGRWHLVGTPESATCTATDDAPDLVCDIRALGAAYLGGSKLAALAGAGLVKEVRPGALAAASTAFGWHEPASTFELY